MPSIHPFINNPYNLTFIFTTQSKEILPLSMSDPTKNRRGYYSKQLAAINQESHEFRRNKKGIKKENKNICREAREKKKMYIQSLEKIKASQEEEIAKLREEVDFLKFTLEAANSKATLQNKVDTGIRDLIAEFKQLIKSLNLKDEGLITRSLAVLRSRFGIAGRDRNKWIEQHLTRVIQLSIPMHFRVLLDNCDNSKAFFSLLGGGDEMKTLRLNFSEQQKRILKLMKPKIKKAKQKYNGIFQRIYSSWTELKTYGEESQKIIDEIEDKVSHPIFIGNLLMNLDNHRNRDPTIREIYPINYFKHLSEQPLIAMNEQANHTPSFFEREDKEAFDMFFYDCNDFH